MAQCVKKTGMEWGAGREEENLQQLFEHYFLLQGFFFLKCDFKVFSMLLWQLSLHRVEGF